MSKMLIDLSTVEQALEALELYVPKEDYENKPVGNVMDALRASLAKQQEPGFWGRVAARQASRIKQLEATGQQALEALRCVDLQSLVPDYGSGHYSVARLDGPQVKSAITAMEAALAEPVQDEQTTIADLRCAKWLDPECADKGACQSLKFKRPADPVQEPFALPCPTPKACRAHCCSGNCIPRSKT